MPIWLLLLLAVAIAGATPSQAASLQETEPDRPRIGLVLSGGGARGAAHIGVLKVLEELRVPIDLITGTSMGAVVGGLYATGYSADELEEIVNNIDWKAALSDDTPREDLAFRRKEDTRQFLIDLDMGHNQGKVNWPKGFLQGQNLELIINSLTSDAIRVNNFDELQIPFRAVAADLATGEQVVLDQGNLGKALRASLSIPGIFAPVEMNDRLLIDGGIANNLPVDVAREMGADIIIAVDASTPLLNQNEIESVFNVVEQLTNMLTRTNTEQRIAMLSDEDILIVPELINIRSAGFRKAPEAIAIAEAAAWQKSHRLATLSLDHQSYESYAIEKYRDVYNETRIDRIRVINRADVSDRFILSRISQEIGEPLDVEALKEEITAIYGLGYFESVDYRVREENGENVLIVEAIQKSWGPNYLTFGLSFEDDLNGDSAYNLAASYNLTALNELGGELQAIVQIGEDSRIFAEYFQPLSFKSSYFAAANVDLEQFNRNEYADDEVLAEYRIKQINAAFALGKELSNWGVIRGSLTWGVGESEVQIGDREQFDDFEFANAAWLLEFTYDRLNNIFFPTEGERIEFLYRMSRETLGADNSFDQVDTNIISAHSRGAHTLQLGLLASLVLNQDTEIQDAATLGGLFHLSGYSEDELSGQDAVLASAIYRYRLPGVLPFYLGGSYEIGNVWAEDESISFSDTVNAGSLFAAAETLLGPVIIGFGYSDSSNNAFYIRVGQSF